MNKIHIIISEISEPECRELVQHLKSTIRDYDPALKVTMHRSSLWLSIRKGHFRLIYSRCRFIETDNRHLIFHYEDKIIRKSGKISDILEKLPSDIFFRCNNSYIVNLHHISKISPEGDRYNIHLRSGEILPLSRSRYQDCLVSLGISTPLS